MLHVVYMIAGLLTLKKVELITSYLLPQSCHSVKLHSVAVNFLNKIKHSQCGVTVIFKADVCTGGLRAPQPYDLYISTCGSIFSYVL